MVPTHIARLAAPLTPAFRGILLRLLPALAVTLAIANPAWALRPDSPKVKKSVARGIKFLEGANDGRIGAQALVGMALLKNYADKTHPRIQEAVTAIQAAVAVGAEAFQHDIYSTGIAILFLVELDPSRYRTEIEILVKSLHLRQKEHGAWGYPVATKDLGATCDTSMTQYAVLGLWEAEDLAGVPTPPEVWDRVARWLIRTQAPDGGFGYQGTPSKTMEERVAQGGVKHTMTAAAMGSMYIVTERLGVRRLRKRIDDDTPPEFQPFEAQVDRTSRLKTKIDLKYFARTMAAGNKWMEDKYVITKIVDADWMHYSLYALERYKSLKEADERGQASPDLAPRWYSQGATRLVDSQQENGSWKGTAGEVPDTAFAVLFLMRSMRKTLEKRGVTKHEAGVMVAGRKLPATDEVRLRDGAVVVKPMQGTLAEVLAVLQRPGDERHAAAREALADLAREGKREDLAANGRDLARLALEGDATGDAEVRLLAVRAIVKSRNLDLVPALIHLLEDADLDVVAAANDGLAGMSRRFDKVKLAAKPSAAERASAVRKWTEWYRTIRPEANVESFDAGELTGPGK